MAHVFKWLCVEALPADKGREGVKYLVTDRDLRYVGVALRDLPEGERLHRDLVERYRPRKQVKRETLELQRAIQKGMLIAHKLSGAAEAAAAIEKARAAYNEAVAAESRAKKGTSRTKATEAKDKAHVELCTAINKYAAVDSTVARCANVLEAMRAFGLDGGQPQGQPKPKPDDGANKEN